jgi:lipoprotein-anchoring transpeptidase ErfK/SrfK
LAALAVVLSLVVFVAIAYGREPATATTGAVRIPVAPAENVTQEGNMPARATPASGPVTLGNPNRVSFWAPIVRRVAARARPTTDSRIVARLGTRTPEGTSNAVLLLQRRESGGQPWLKVRLPVLPNNTTGWVPRASLGGYQAVNTHLLVDRRRLNAVLYRLGRPVFRAPVGIGQRRWPTPAGRFYLRNKLTGYRSPFYGPIAFGTSARSSVLTDWPAGGFVGIHGTNAPELVPGRVSHGCIRMRNGDIVRLARLMPPGTPLSIH